MPHHEQLSPEGPEQDPKRLLIAQLELSIDRRQTPRIKGDIPMGTTSFHNHYEGWSLGVLGRQHKERASNNQRIVEALMLPGTEITKADVLEMTAAYYLGTYASWECYEDGLPYPPIPEGEWIAPIRVTYQGLQEGAVPFTNLLKIPTFADHEKAMEGARDEVLWENFRAGSRQIKMLGAEVLLSGKLLEADKKPYWQKVALYTPSQTAKNDQSEAALKDHLKVAGYEFPNEKLPKID